MRIQHNIAALNSYRQLGGNNNALSKNLEKLSSGYRINRAGDDAAGLAISEKMRAQIKGLEAAQKNANDGISLVQTAEGALTEVHSMLNRMAYLATQSANGTYDDGVDRQNLQKEVESLLSEIDRISESTNFNSINLLDGSLGGPKVETTKGVAGTAEGAGQGGSVVNEGIMTLNAASPAAEGGASLAGGDVNVVADSYTPSAGTVSVKFSAVTVNSGASTKATGIEFKIGDVTVELSEEELLTAAGEGTTVSAAKVATLVSGKLTDKALYGTSLTSSHLSVSGDTLAIDIGTAFQEAPATFPVSAEVKTGTTSGEVQKGGSTNGTIDGGTFGTPVVNDGTATSAAKISVGVSGIKVPSNFVSGTKSFTIGNQTVDIEVKGNMTDIEVADAIEAALKDKTITIDGHDFKIDTSSESNLMTLAAGDNTIDLVAVNNGETGLTAEDVAGAVSSANLDVKFEAGTPAPSTATMDFDGRTVDDMVGGTITVAGKTYEFVKAGEAAKTEGAGKIELAEGMKGADIAAAVKGALGADTDITDKYDVAVSGTKVTLTEKADDEGKFSGEDVDLKVIGSGLSLQIGDTADDFNKLKVLVGDMSTKALGIADININTQEGASEAIDKIKEAINTVSSTRGDLGAIQNRLEHTINNLGVTTENLTAAESRIRDTDMAEEMMAYTKNNILVQAAQAMLAQANQVPQGVLQLLQ